MVSQLISFVTLDISYQIFIHSPFFFHVNVFIQRDLTVC